MTRRNGVGVKVILTVAIGLVVIYGLYSYHEIHTRLKKSDEKGERLRQQHDSLSAQLQVVYEHKSRLEKSLQQEKSDHRKSRNDLLTQKSELETRFYNEKQELLNRISSINQEHKMLQSQHEDLQTELSKLQEKLTKLQEDNDVVQSNHNAEFQQLKQEKENELASLRDEVANLQRKNVELTNKLDLIMQSNRHNMNQVDADQKTIYSLKEQIADLQKKQLDAQQQYMKQSQQQPVAVNQQQQQPVIINQQQQQPNYNAGDQFQKQPLQQQQQQQPQFQNQGADQQAVNYQQQQPQAGFGQRAFNQPGLLRDQEPQNNIQNNINNFNQVPLQQKQLGDNLQDQQKVLEVGDPMLQHVNNEQKQEQQEEQNNQVNQMQVNAPDADQDLERGGRFAYDNRDDQEVEPGRLKKDFPDGLKRQEDGMMQIGKPRFGADVNEGDRRGQGDHQFGQVGNNEDDEDEDKQDAPGHLQGQNEMIDQNPMQAQAPLLHPGFNEQQQQPQQMLGPGPMEGHEANQGRLLGQIGAARDQVRLAHQMPRPNMDDNNNQDYQDEDLNRNKIELVPQPNEDDIKRQPHPDADVYNKNVNNDHKEADQDEYGEEINDDDDNPDGMQQRQRDF